MARWGIAGLVVAATLVLAGTAGAFGHIARFNPSAYTVAEGAGTVTVTVERDGPSGDGSVDYETVDGTAKAGQDYQSASGTLTWANGEVTKTFTVQITQDAAAEGSETFQARLKNPQGAVSSPGGPATVTITDDDQASPAPPTSPPAATATPAPTRPTATPERTTERPRQTNGRTATATPAQTAAPAPTPAGAASPDGTVTSEPDEDSEATTDPDRPDAGLDAAADPPDEGGGGSLGPVLGALAAVALASAGGVGLYAWRRRAI